MLQVGEGDAAHQRVPVQAGPGAPFEMAQARFLLELLVRLLADPARLDRAGQGPQRGPGRRVAEVALALAVRAPLARQPSFPARQAARRAAPARAGRSPPAPCHRRRLLSARPCRHNARGRLSVSPTATSWPGGPAGSVLGGLHDRRRSVRRPRSGAGRRRPSPGRAAGPRRAPRHPRADASASTASTNACGLNGLRSTRASACPPVSQFSP